MQGNYKIGDFFELKRVFTYSDVIKFSELSSDFNPIHLDASAASKSIFGKPIVHGMLVASLFSSIIANHLPGPGSIYLHQSLDFKMPVYHDEMVTAKVEITYLKPEKSIFELQTLCFNNSGKIVIEGKAIILNKSL